MATPLSFSQRAGYTPVPIELQTESMDRVLRSDLWNLLLEYCFDFIYYDNSFHRELYNKNIPLERVEGFWFAQSLWKDFFHQGLDRIPRTVWAFKQAVRDWYDKAEWYRVYDLIEFIFGELEDPAEIEDFTGALNEILEQNRAGYRMVGGLITPITDSASLQAVEAALQQTGDRCGGARAHLEAALRLMSDRERPDWRNSIKESISAVEALCALIAGDSCASLGGALKLIQKKGTVPLHPSLASGFEKLYGYTSDGDGIRHAMMDEPDLAFEDALYMLASCSAFVSYLIVKADKSGLFC